MTTRHNCGVPETWLGPSIDVAKKMAAFDRLPPAVRQRLNDAKFSFCPIATVDLLRRYGETGFFAVIDATERQVERAAA